MSAFTNVKDTEQELEIPSSCSVPPPEINYQDATEMKAIASLSKKLWSVLNADITPHLQAIRDNILDIYDPELVPIHSGGMTIEWVSARTGERLWT